MNVHSILNKPRTIVIVVALTGSTLFLFRNNILKPSATPSKVVATKMFSYRGQNGRDALSLLKEKTEVKSDMSGLIISINGYQADTKKTRILGIVY